MNDLPSIQGSDQLIQIFGGWPSFHDAEVLSARLDRNGSVVELEVHVWRLTSDVDAGGFYRRENEIIVLLRFTGVTGLTLSGLNEQNVLFGLEVEPAPGGIAVELFPCYGLGGSFVCESAEVLEIRRVPGSTV